MRIIAAPSRAAQVSPLFIALRDHSCHGSYGQTRRRRRIRKRGERRRLSSSFSASILLLLRLMRVAVLITIELPQQSRLRGRFSRSDTHSAISIAEFTGQDRCSQQGTPTVHWSNSCLIPVGKLLSAPRWWPSTVRLWRGPLESPMSGKRICVTDGADE